MSNSKPNELDVILANINKRLLETNEEVGNLKKVIFETKEQIKGLSIAINNLASTINKKG